MVSVNVADPVPPLAELVMVNTYCMVCERPSVAVLVRGSVVPARTCLATAKSVPTVSVAWLGAVLLPAVVLRLPAGMVLT